MSERVSEEPFTPLVRDRLAVVSENVTRVAAAARRDASTIRVMAVTKLLPWSHVAAARAAGIDMIGENRVQEACDKHVGARDYELHLVGHLQRNKARDAVALFDVIQSIDKASTAVALERHCAAVERTIGVLLELNASGEASKSGYATESELLDEAHQIAGGCPHLRIGGVMTIGAHAEDTATISRSFARLRAVHERLLADHPEATTLSMGMSNDYELAIAEGATLIRLGTALLGPRP